MNLKLLRQLIWIYFLLWIFEGALRFWVLPGLANPLLYVRDPVVLVIYVVASKLGCVRMNGFILLTLALALATAVSTMLFGHGRIDVMLIGLRSNFLHLPLIFVVGSALDAKDLLKIGRWTILLAVPMALIVVLQFRSPQGSWINQGGMFTHYGTVRPAGTFSFAAGLAGYLSLLAAVLVLSVLKRSGIGLLYRVAGALSLVLMLSVSGSRTAIAAVGVVGALGVLCSTRARGGLAGLTSLLMLGLMAFAFVSSTEFGEEGVEQLQYRFRDASQGESSILMSFLERLESITTGTLQWAISDKLVGYGIGAGTSAGGFLLTGQRTMLGGEAEWGRLLYEMGTFFGLVFVLLRVGLARHCFVLGWRAFQAGNPGPMLLFGCAWLHLLTGQWGIPSLQGFAALAGGLCIAHYRVGAMQAKAAKKKRSMRTIELEAEEARLIHSEPGRVA